jgi:hypothetical protein
LYQAPNRPRTCPSVASGPCHPTSTPIDPQTERPDIPIVVPIAPRSPATDVNTRCYPNHHSKHALSAHFLVLTLVTLHQLRLGALALSNDVFMTSSGGGFASAGGYAPTPTWSEPSLTLPASPITPTQRKSCPRARCLELSSSSIAAEIRLL